MTSLGFEHSIAVTDKGEALSWGDGDSGRLGHGHELSILGFKKSCSEYTPRLIKELEGVKVKNVSAGMLHSACICENGSLYFFGERKLGKWGFRKAKSAATPSIISPFPLSGEVACGGYHTCHYKYPVVGSTQQQLLGQYLHMGLGGSNGTFKEDGYSPGRQLRDHSKRGANFAMLSPLTIWPVKGSW